MLQLQFTMSVELLIARTQEGQILGLTGAISPLDK